MSTVNGGVVLGLLVLFVGLASLTHRHIGDTVDAVCGRAQGGRLR